MRLLVDRVSEAQRALRWRGVLLLVGGAILGIWGSFWSFVFVAHWVTEPKKDVAIEIAALLAIGLAPLAAAGFLLHRFWRGQRRLRSMSDLARLAWGGTALERDRVAAALGVSVARAERLLLDAMEMGVLGEALPLPNATLGQAPTVASSGTRPAASADLVGQVVGAYQVESYLASGGMGVIYVARHRRTGRRYALKSLPEPLGASATADKRFEREATSAGSLGHPGIVAIHDFDRLPNGTPYLVMDLLEGETLERRLQQRGRLSWSDAQRIALQLADALAFAHDRGLVHRDIKPSNVFMQRGATGVDERAVLLDFGLAKPMDVHATRVTATGQAVGTPLYMSPEQARGEPIDQRSDVYSLAAVIYEMVTGAPPFMDQTLAQVYARLLREVAAAPSALSRSCPPALDAVLACALAKTPAERYPDMRHFMHALAQIADVPASATA